MKQQSKPSARLPMPAVYFAQELESRIDCASEENASKNDRWDLNGPERGSVLRSIILPAYPGQAQNFFVPKLFCNSLARSVCLLSGHSTISLAQALTSWR